MILVLISPRNAGLPFAQWLSEESGRLVAVTAAGVEVGDGFAEVFTVADYTDDDAVLDVDRAAMLRGELGLPGLTTVGATVYRDKIPMKVFARAAGIRVPDFAPVT